MEAVSTRSVICWAVTRTPKGCHHGAFVSSKNRSRMSKGAYSLTTTETKVREDMKMKVINKFAILSLVTASTVFAQSPQQVGAWSVYSPAGNGTAKNVVMLQTTAVGQHQDARGDVAPAKLDIVCKNNKVVAVALETGSRIDKRTVSYEQAVPTTAVVFTGQGKSS